MITFIISLLLLGIVLFLFMFQMLKNTRKYSFRSAGISKRRKAAFQFGVGSFFCILVGILLIIFNGK